MIRPACQVGWFALVFISATTGDQVFGQGNTFNPYGNSGYADYREFTTPMYANDPSLPGQARLQNGVAGRNRANQFESYLNSVNSADSDVYGSGRSAPSGVPYHQLPRSGSRDRQTYRANDTEAERLYQQQVKQRDAAYFKALDEKDPRKRALLLQQIERRDVVRRSPNTTRTTRGTATPATTNRRVPTPATSAVAPPDTSGRTATPPPAGTTTNSAEAVPAVNPASVPIPAPN